jgi:carboxypeptidase Taq
MNAYKTLAALSKQATLAEGIEGLLGWDQETYMPHAAAPIRAEQKEYLAKLSHQVRTSPAYEEALSSLVDLESGNITGQGLSDEQKAAVRAWRHDFLRLKKLPSSFVQEFAATTSQAIFVWQQAKSENNFALFEPHLAHICELVRQKAEYIGFTAHPYDALIDEFEPGCTTNEIDILFGQLLQAIPRLAAELSEANTAASNSGLIDLTRDEQINAARRVLDCIHYDFSCGRMDLSCHPFSTSYHPTDCRITTRAEPHGLFMQALTTLHEAGHSMYEMNLPTEHFGTPLAQAISYGMHESQSRFWETRIARTIHFWRFFLPIAAKMFPSKISSISPDDFFRANSRVSPSLIRVDSDEVTYPLHIIIRFVLEKELLRGGISTKEIPEAWNEAMKDTLGIVPPSDSEGCLQDIHWSMGSFGYFPSYTLGNIICSCLFETFEHSHPDWGARVEAGDFEFIKTWLRSAIWRHGRRYTSREIVEKVTGKTISAEPYIRYLSAKYRQISHG